MKLDHICEGIADERRTKNAAIIEETALIAAAQKRMEGRNVTAYKHAGVELVLIPGSNHIRVRLVKDTGDADVSGGETRSNNAEDTDTAAVDQGPGGDEAGE